MKALLTASLIAGLLGAGAAHAAPPVNGCLDRLNDRAYTCEVRSSASSFTTATLAFANGTLTLDGETTADCSCGDGGTLETPKFDLNQTKWTCVAAFLPEGSTVPLAIAIQGTVSKAGKLSRVTGADNIGLSYLFECDLIPPSPMANQ